MLPESPRVIKKMHEYARENNHQHSLMVATMHALSDASGTAISDHIGVHSDESIDIRNFIYECISDGYAHAAVTIIKAFCGRMDADIHESIDNHNRQIKAFYEMHSMNIQDRKIDNGDARAIDCIRSLTNLLEDIVEDTLPEDATSHYSIDSLMYAAFVVDSLREPL